MEAELQELLGQQVQFVPVTGVDIEGGLSYGTATDPVPCRVSFPKQGRTISARNEETQGEWQIILRPEDLDTDVVTIGARVLGIPAVDGADQLVSLVTEIAAHYEIDPEGLGLVGNDLDAPTLHHWTVTVRVS